MSLRKKCEDNDSNPNLSSKTISHKDNLEIYTNNLTNFESSIQINQNISKEINQLSHNNLESKNNSGGVKNNANALRKCLGISHSKLDEVNVYSKRKKELQFSRDYSQESFEKQSQRDYKDPRIYASEDIVEYIETLCGGNVDSPAGAQYKSVLKEYFLTHDKKAFFKDIPDTNLQTVFKMAKRQNAKFRNLNIFLTGLINECIKFSNWKTKFESEKNKQYNNIKKYLDSSGYKSKDNFRNLKNMSSDMLIDKNSKKMNKILYDGSKKLDFSRLGSTQFTNLNNDTGYN